MPKIVDHDARRRELASACFQLLAERGYAGASMRQLARSAGVSTGTLYHYFPTKHAILVHVFDTMLAEDQEGLRATFPSEASLTRKIKAVVDYAEARERALRDLLLLAVEMVRHEPEPEVVEIVEEAAARYRATIGEILGVDDEGQVSLLFSLLVGILVHGILEPRSEAERATLDGLLGVFLGARAPDETNSDDG